MAQSAIIGVLIVGPLLYTQTVPLMTRLPDVLIFRPTVAPPPVDVVTTTQSSAPTRVTPRLFVPTTVPKGAPRPTTVTDLITTVPPDAILVADPGVGAVNVPPLMPPFAAPEPAKEPASTIVTAAPAPDLSKPLRISGGVLAAKLITQIVPKYPPLARQTRVSGIVRLLGIIDRDGHVRNLRVLDGPPLLRQAALDAVGQWVYAPTLLNGQPVEVEAPIDVHFQLN
ncbi:MAG: hypothetical protein RL328_1501 [Acidobacteriota bacterium]